MIQGKSVLNNSGACSCNGPEDRRGGFFGCDGRRFEKFVDVGVELSEGDFGFARRFGG